MNSTKIGVRWHNGQLEHRKEWEKDDIKLGLTDEKRTVAVVRDMMNSIFRNIQVTVEVPGDFDDNKLPVLDFKCWVQDDDKKQDATPEMPRKLLYTFFEKKMNYKYAIRKSSAMPENMKVNSLTNDMIRRMKNTSELLGQPERNAVVDSYAARLLRSGYPREKVKQMIEAGLKGYEKIVENERLGKGKIHRNGASTANSRYKKKLTGKSSWYLTKQNDEVEEPDKDNINSQPSRPQSGPAGGNSAKGEVPTTTVLFVPHTYGGELATRMRMAEAGLQTLLGTKVKIVEKNGTTLKQILVKSNPWSGAKCGRTNCLPCNSGEGAGDCSRRSITYMTSCGPCKDKGNDKVYVGESSRTAFERGLEQWSISMTMR